MDKIIVPHGVLAVLDVPGLLDGDGYNQADTDRDGEAV